MFDSLFHFKTYFAASMCDDNRGGLPTLWRDIPCDTKTGELNIESLNDTKVVLANLTEIILLLAGSAAVVIIVAASIYYITSAGDAGRVKKAKDMIVNSAVGLVIIIVAYAVVEFIRKGLA